MTDELLEAHAALLPAGLAPAASTTGPDPALAR
jgi:hypothetical protein